MTHYDILQDKSTLLLIRPAVYRLREIILKKEKYQCNDVIFTPIKVERESETKFKIGRLKVESQPRIVIILLVLQTLET